MLIPKLWKIWLIVVSIMSLSLIFQAAFGGKDYLRGREKDIPVLLQQGFQTEWTTFRPFPTNASLFYMEYPFAKQLTNEQRYQLLGEWITDGRWKHDRNQIYFMGEMGVPVLTRLELNGKSCVLEQSPIAGGFSRMLTPDDHSERTINWFDNWAENCRYAERTGKNHWRLTVETVGEQLNGKNATLIMPSPFGDLKSVPSNIYGLIAGLNFLFRYLGLPLMGVLAIVLLIIQFVLKKRK